MRFSKRYLLLSLVISLALIGGLLVSGVNVNADTTASESQVMQQTQDPNVVSRSDAVIGGTPMIGQDEAFDNGQESLQQAQQKLDGQSRNVVQNQSGQGQQQTLQTKQSQPIYNQNETKQDEISQNQVSQQLMTQNQETQSVSSVTNQNNAGYVTEPATGQVVRQSKMLPQTGSNGAQGLALAGLGAMFGFLGLGVGAKHIK